jgi:hypothetical protein
MEMQKTGYGKRAPIARPRKSGNALLELLAFLAVIGLLAGYVWPQYFSRVGKSDIQEPALILTFCRAPDSSRPNNGYSPSTGSRLVSLDLRPAHAAKPDAPRLSPSTSPAHQGNAPVIKRIGDQPANGGKHHAL